MTVQEILTSPDFNNFSISKQVFGKSRAISDKINNNRGNSWKEGDFKLIAEYFKNKYKIICE